MKKHTAPTIQHSTRATATKVKQLKVHQKYFSRAYHTYVVFPEIRLSGKWLQDIGFSCGQEVSVVQEVNKITITILQQGIKADR